ncbi:MAG: hypothetical protein LBK00_03470 [Treponema sp.]|jgi:hypothetical protein|nr:hypothetical protein [Treponema sp.]
MKKSFGLLAALVAVIFAALLLPGCPTEAENTNSGNNKGGNTTDDNSKGGDNKGDNTGKDDNTGKGNDNSPASATMTWSGDWTRVSDTIYTSNAIGHSANTIERLNITASGAGTITIQITASSEGADRGYASKLDTGVSTSEYQMRVSGTQVATYTYDIPSGSHWIQFMYQKDYRDTSGSDNVTVEIISSSFASSAATTATLKVQNQSSFTLSDIKWGNAMGAASLALSESTTLNVSEGTSYLYFTKGSTNGLKCRTKEVIAVAKDETVTKTIIDNTVVVELDDLTNEGPLGTITPRETKLTIKNNSSVTLVDVKWGSEEVSTSLAPGGSTTLDVTEGSNYLYFNKGSADGLKCQTKDPIAVAKDETVTQTITNDTVVVALDDTTNEAPLGTIAPPSASATLTWGGSWTRVSGTKYTSNAIGHSANTIERLDITASGAGTITIQITASSEVYNSYYGYGDCGYVSKLDTGVSTSEYQMQASGTTVATYTYAIPSGSHWIQFMYQKDGSGISGSDNVTVEIISSSFEFTAPQETTLTIQNNSFTELTDVIWNNVSFANNTVEGSIKIGTSVPNTVSAGSGYIFFKRKSNPIIARTKDLVIIAEYDNKTIAFEDSTEIVEVNNQDNTGTLGGLQTTVVFLDDAEGELQSYYEAASFVGYYAADADLLYTNSSYNRYNTPKNGQKSIAVGGTNTAKLHLKISLDKAAKLSFWYANKDNPYSSSGQTTFSINGTTQRTWTTDVNWSKVEYDLEAGVNDLVWAKTDGYYSYPYCYYLTLDDILIYYK